MSSTTTSAQSQLIPGACSKDAAMQCAIGQSADSPASLGRTLFSRPSSDQSNAIVVSHGAMPNEGISAGDLLRIDFTINTIEDDGLYVVTLDGEWIGYKRFQRIPGVLFDVTDSMLVSPDILEKVEVVGLVKEIYRSDRH